jgi:ribonuclease HII
VCTNVAKSRQSPDSHLEAQLYRHGIRLVAGLDEAGRGAWAGPIMAAAVVLPYPNAALQAQLQGLQDSKQLTALGRARWDQIIRAIALSVSEGQASVEEIDRLGILPATRLAMQRAVHGLETGAEYLLIDYILIGDVGINQTAIPRGDACTLSIAAASVIAKVARDRLMINLDRQYPSFGFAQHKGYGTRQHQEALNRWGPSKVHRRSFKPIRRVLGEA